MMEFSSPLASMAPPPYPRTFGCGRQAGRAIAAAASGTFNFRDLSMRAKSQGDYFSLQPNGPIRGSSPTASLAADLSQNFHIDQSPQLPTPRRSLFTSGLFTNQAAREGATTPPVKWEGVTTPPIPSSSPMPGSDVMDCSPLPHKPPFGLSRASSYSITSSNVHTPADDDMGSTMGSSLNPTPASSFFLKPSHLLERKAFARPSLTRTKCFSTNTVAQIPRSQENQPTFRFGAGGNGRTSSASNITRLDECFVESPVQDRVAASPLCDMSQSRPSFALNGMNRRNGSPRGGHVKKLSDQPSVRPRKLFRRSLSMFGSPADVMKQEKKDYEPTGLQSVMDIDDAHELRLPHYVPTDTPCSLPRINQDTVVRVLNGEFSHLYDRVMLIDARFEYEFTGGHIDTAQNYNDKEALARELFEPAPTANTLLIFHCEYSQQRAPLMAQHVRKHDRTYNAANYPHLSYPELYILDGGYSAFFKLHRSRCYPQNYVGMEDAKHELAMEQGLGKLKQRKPLQRSITYAFGQSPCQMDESPIRFANTKMNISSTLLSMDIGFARSPARRLASY